MNHDRRQRRFRYSRRLLLTVAHCGSLSVCPSTKARTRGGPLSRLSQHSATSRSDQPCAICDLFVDMDDQVIVIRENRVGADIDGEGLGKMGQPHLNCTFAIRVVLSGQRVDAA